MQERPSQELRPSRQRVPPIDEVFTVVIYEDHPYARAKGCHPTYSHFLEGECSSAVGAEGGSLWSFWAVGDIGIQFLDVGFEFEQFREFVAGSGNRLP